MCVSMECECLYGVYEVCERLYDAYGVGVCVCVCVWSVRVCVCQRGGQRQPSVGRRVVTASDGEAVALRSRDD